MQDFISGEIRVYEDGDFWIEALIFPQSFIKSTKNFQFENIDEELEKYFPSSNETKNFWSGEKENKEQKNNHVLNWKIDNVLNWTIDDVYKRLVEDLKIDENEAKILKEQFISGNVLVDLNEDDLKEMNLKVGTRKQLVQQIKNISN